MASEGDRKHCFPLMFSELSQTHFSASLPPLPTLLLLFGCTLSHRVANELFLILRTIINIFSMFQTF